MNKWKLIISYSTISIVIISIVLAVNLSTNSKTSVYTFSGKNDIIQVRDAIIVLEPKNEFLLPGSISYIGDEISDIISFSVQLYIQKEEEKVILTSQGHSTDADAGYLSFPKDMITELYHGTGYGKETFNEFENNLFLSLSVIQKDSTEFQTTVKLDVQNINDLFE